MSAPDWIRRWPTAWLAAMVVAPLVIVGVVLLWHPWAPVLDLAMTELRVRDVGTRQTPLIGLPGRIGDFPDQGSHPGPWSFYLIAPFYRLAGSSAWGMQLGSIVINAAAIIGSVMIGRRLGGAKGAAAVALLAAIALRGYGLTVLTHPWNPYFPLLLWMLVLVAAWAVLAGQPWMALVVVGVGSIAAQTHVPYLLNCVAMSALVLAILAWRARTAAPEERSQAVRPLTASLALGTVMWLPAIVDQLFRNPGNARMLLDHFASEPPEPTIGVGNGIGLFFRHLDAQAAFGNLLTHQDAFVYRSGLAAGSSIGGMTVFVLFLASCWHARRLGHRNLIALNWVLSLVLVVQLFAMTRIFGKVWFYLTLWAWGTMLFVVLSIAWATWLLVREYRPLDGSGVIVRLGVVLAAAISLVSVGAAGSYRVPEEQLSDGLRAVVAPTADALANGDGAAVGADGRYLVFWQDSVFIGAQGYGLLNELERLGFSVGVHNTWRIPVTHQRVFAPGTYDAEVHLVSGVFIEEWRQRDGYTEVATVDVRTAAERQRFIEVRTEVVERLSNIGRAEVISVVDENLFGASLDPDLPPDIIRSLSEMLELAEPVAVFIAPPGSTF